MFKQQKTTNTQNISSKNDPKQKGLPQRGGPYANKSTNKRQVLKKQKCTQILQNYRHGGVALECPRWGDPLPGKSPPCDARRALRDTRKYEKPHWRGDMTYHLFGIGYLSTSHSGALL